MPTPQQVTSTITQLPVWEVDNFGNTKQDGGVMLKTRATPTPTPSGYLQLYSPDGSVLKTIGPSGTVSTIPAQDASGNMTVGGNLTVTGGTITLGADTNVYRGGADTLQTDDYFVMPNGQASGSFSVFGGQPDSLKLGTAGGGIAIKTGTNARMGTSTLVGGTVTVNNTSVTANTVIMAFCQAQAGTPGFLRISTRVAATSFTILSSSGTDTSLVGWILYEPAA